MGAKEIRVLSKGHCPEAVALIGFTRCVWNLCAFENFPNMYAYQTCGAYWCGEWKSVLGRASAVF